MSQQQPRNRKGGPRRAASRALGISGRLASGALKMLSTAKTIAHYFHFRFP